MLLETQNLTKKYANKLAVNQVNLTIRQGSFTTLLGTNGAGKSTLINMMIGLKKPTSGQVLTAKHLKIGVVFQNSVLDAQLTVHENLRIRAHQYANLDFNRIPQLERQLNLNQFRNQSYGTLSGGQKRRADIARALLNDPDILFLDEPTTGLDVQTRNSIWQLLLQLQEKQGLTILLTTHYLEEADQADFSYFLNQGKIVAAGTTQEIITNYAQNKLKLKPRSIPELVPTLQQLNFKFKQEKDMLIVTPQTTEQAIELLNKVGEQLVNFAYSPGSIATAFMNITGWEAK